MKAQVLYKNAKRFDHDLKEVNVKVGVDLFGIVGRLDGSILTTYQIGVMGVIPLTGSPTVDTPAVVLGFGSSLLGSPTLDTPAVSWA